MRNLDGGSTTAGKRSSGEFIGQFTRGVVGVVSAKRNRGIARGGVAHSNGYYPPYWRARAMPLAHAGIMNYGVSYEVGVFDGSL